MEFRKSLHAVLKGIFQWKAGFRAGVLVFMSAVTTGCGGSQIEHLKTTDDFGRQVFQASKPVLVEFYKGGCPTCLVLEPGLERLAKEYKGRVEFASFELMTPYFRVTAPELKDLYEISYFPTVILFVEGEEKRRWILEYDLEEYRVALNDTVKSKSE